MKKRGVVRLVSYCLAALLIMGGFLTQALVREAASRRYLEAGWRRAFSSLASDMDRIDTALKKSRFSSSAMLAGSACAEVSARAQAAQSCLGELPFSDYLLENTAGFLGRLGDYTQSLSRSAYTGGLRTEDRETLAALQAAATELKTQLTGLEAELDAGMVTVGQLSKADEAALSGRELLGQRLLDLEDRFPELPTLIYDGPYSHSVTEGEPRYLAGLEPVTEAEAIRAAARFTGLPEADFTVAARAAGKLPCYLLSAGTGEGELTLRVTKTGGVVLDMVCAHAGGGELISEETAVQTARRFLEDHGYAHMQDSYWTREDGTILFNFAYSQDGVVCYPDLVKVRVALDGGRVVGFDAAGYVMNHQSRSLPEPVSAETGRGAVSPALTVLSEGLAVIPTEGKQERFCWEYRCADAEGSHYIVYADAADGREAKLFILLEDENGTLVL